MLVDRACDERYPEQAIMITDMMQRISILAGFLAAAALAVCAESPFVGIWEAKENGLPSVELTIRNENGHISGVIGFYLQTRGQDGKWHLADKTPFTTPLISPKIQNAVLTFETIHHKQHDSPELGPNNSYRVTFIGPKKARLQIFKGQEKENNSQAELTRRE